MHPDFSLVLQKCASNLSLKHKQPFLIKAFLNSKNMASSPNHRSENQEDLVRIVSDEEDEAAGDYREEGTEDNISLCSELSVGKENPAQERPSHMAEEEDEEEDEILDISDTHSNASSHNEAPNTPSPGINSADQGLNPFALAHNLRFPVPFALQNNNNSNPAANMSPFQEEFLRKSHLYAEELMKHQMQLMAAARASAFSLRSHHALPPQLQHSAQLSAAPSLVHHLNPLAKIGQLSAAAAAALSVAAQQQQQHKSLNHVPNPHVAAPHHMLSHHATNLNHQQYDTLAKLTDLTKQHSPSSPSHASSNTAHQMMSTLNQLQTQMQAHLPGLLHDNNDNLHERALKFSIDNILKADFGRSNSLDSPPQQRKNNHGKSHSQRHKLPNPSTCSSSASASSSLTSNILTDSLEHSMQSLSHNISPTTQTFSSSLATICTNSNDSSSTAVSSSYSSANGTVDLVKSSPSQTPTLSPGFSSSTENGGGNAGSHNKNAANKSEETASSTTTTSTSATGTGSGPIVWPAWVYCTRYSDRPSSGKSALTGIEEDPVNCFILFSFLKVLRDLFKLNFLF
ncbi:invected isoform 2-T5 [Cochliomyia hominivorax]